MDSYYNPWLVTLSVLIAVFAAYTALSLASRIFGAEPKVVRYWLAGGAFSMGTGIWAMHFIGMLAFHLPIPLAYDPLITAISVVPAWLASAIALQVLRGDRRDLRVLLIAGLFMGVGIATMHYTGMEAMLMDPPIQYAPDLFILSVVIAIVASIAALDIAFRLRLRMASDAGYLGWKLLSSLVMGIAIAGTHYMGMAAAEFAPNAVCRAGLQGIDPGWLAIIVSTGGVSVLLLTMVVSIFDARLADQNARRVEELDRVNTQLNEMAAELAEAMTHELRHGAERDGMLAAIVKQSSEAIITLDLEGGITSWNSAAEEMFGYREEDVLGRRTAEFCLLADQGKEPEFEEGVIELGAQHKDGSPLDIEVSIAPLQDQEGQQIGQIRVVRDITAKKSAEAQLRQAAAVFENTIEGVIITDPDGHIMAVNRAYSDITGYTERDALGSVAEFADRTIHDSEFFEKLWAVLIEEGRWRGEFVAHRKGGEHYPQWANISAVRDEHGGLTHYVAVISDITHLKESEEQLYRIAHHDALTDLPNRLLFEDRLQHAILRAKRSNSPMAVLFLDLDRFKHINDNLGHAVGDQLLQDIAWRLQRTVRSEDTVARLGGDEFTVILEGVEDREQIETVAAKILDELRQPVRIGEHELFVSTSIGIAVMPDNGVAAEELLRFADAAMYRAKEEGRNNYKFYSADLAESALYFFQIERELRQALERNELCLHYQPQISFRSGMIVAVEALLRWQHPQRGLLLPKDFIDVAEESGLMAQLEEWVLERACRQLREWSEQGQPAIKIAVNLTSGQISHSNIADRLKGLLAETGVAAESLQLEITESSLLQQTEVSVANLKALDALGVGLVIDDFGTGYSSMAYLKRFAVSKLKIDRSFVHDIETDPNDKAIVRAVIAMAHGLGLKVTAEGVETEGQYLFLKEQGCDELQGFIFSTPLPAEKLVECLLKGEPFNPLVDNIL